MIEKCKNIIFRDTFRVNYSNFLRTDNHMFNYNHKKKLFYIYIYNELIGVI